MLNKLLYFYVDATIEIFVCLIDVSIFELYFCLILKIMNTDPHLVEFCLYSFKIGGEISR